MPIADALASFFELTLVSSALLAPRRWPDATVELHVRNAQDCRACADTRNMTIREYAANVLVWGLALLLVLSPLALGLSFAFPAEGNPYLGEEDTPNGFFLFLAGAIAVAGMIMTLVGVHRVVTLVEDVGRAALRHLSTSEGDDE